MCVISPNLGVAKVLPCVRDKASKNCEKKNKKIGKNEESNH